MILKNSVIAVIFCIAWIDGIIGTSYSKVYVNSGSNGPYQYVGYGAPAVAYNAPIAQLSAAPIGSVVPYSQAASFVPCVSPCVPQKPVAQVTNAGLVAYTAPRTVVVAKDVPTNYEYSYVVYDDGTGDQKAARELSDGGVVRGQYSFLQPDGYVREVQYTADDVTGFNAVVNYLPGNGQKTVAVQEAKPCPDVKSEDLKQAVDPPSDVDKSGEQESKSSAEIPASGEEPAKETPAETPAPEAPAPESPAPELPAAEAPAPEAPAAEAPAPEAPAAESPAPEAPAPEAPASEAPAHEAPAHEAPAHEAPAHEAPAAEAPAPEAPAHEAPAPEAPAPEAPAAEAPAPEAPAHEAPAHEAPAPEEPAPEAPAPEAPAPEAVSAEVKEDTTQVVENAIVEAVDAPQPGAAIITNTLPPGYVSYDQLLKCIQKMQNADLRINSPLTYILLPSNAKPC